MLSKYLGEIVEIVYMDRSNQLTQRRIEIKHIRKGLVYADCLRTGSPRTFREDQILAWQPAKSKLKPTIKPVQPLHPRLTGYTTSPTIDATARQTTESSATAITQPVVRPTATRRKFISITTTRSLRHSTTPNVASTSPTQVS
ncbi:hypothetical protein PQ456_15175 [Paenibacillus kyungheensis]|uniref:WYL domain-containing protein n=1 Tax=Paenibacillus kyungheensis TaxID=1452732 RepID=A0AAX3LZ79_9BACL|nr:hypothetical protein [Paenibacillus kyungheensis]WCT54538.1 hypothetical protein PQ456_15175 [Paenibacillus kyungheensis]